MCLVYRHSAVFAICFGFVKLFLAIKITRNGLKRCLTWALELDRVSVICSSLFICYCVTGYCNVQTPSTKWRELSLLTQNNCILCCLNTIVQQQGHSLMELLHTKRQIAEKCLLPQISSPALWRPPNSTAGWEFYMSATVCFLLLISF